MRQVNGCRAGEASLEQANSLFLSLPRYLQIASLSPYGVYFECQNIKQATPKFLYYRETGRIWVKFLILYNGISPKVNDVQSSNGYGGALSSCICPRFLRRAKRFYLDWLAKNDVMVEYCKLHPMVDYGGVETLSLVYNRKTVYIDLKTDLLSQCRKTTRNILRRIEVSKLEFARVSSGEMLNIFPDLYRNMLDKKNSNRRHYYCDSYFRSLLALEDVHAWVAYSKGSIVSGCVILVSQSSSLVEYHLSASSSEGYSLQASLFLLHKIAQCYKLKGFDMFYLGGGKTSSDDDPLLHFKCNHSRKTVPFYYGYKIYNKDAYMNIKNNMCGNNNIIFYR